MRKQSEPVFHAFLSGSPPDPALFTVDTFLQNVHWSWFLPTLKTYSETEQKLFLSALETSAAKNLAKTLDLISREEELSAPAKEYFRQILLDSLMDPNHVPLPTAYLEQTPLAALLHLSKKELSRLIDLLALHDLAFELRQIVETKILKQIYSFLSEEEKKFIKKIQPIAPSRLGLNRWDGTEEAFRTLLHRKGLARFAAAISGQNQDFLWHICHKLDIGRGSALFKLCATKPSPKLQEAMIRQIEELL